MSETKDIHAFVRARVCSQVAFTLIFNVFFNYLSTVLTPPGYTPYDYVSSAELAEEEGQKV